MPNTCSITGGEKRGKAAGWEVGEKSTRKKNVRAPPAGLEQRCRPAGLGRGGRGRPWGNRGRSLLGSLTQNSHNAHQVSPTWQCARLCEGCKTSDR